MSFAMRARRLWFGLLGTVLLASVPAPAGAQAVGSEFQVNTYTTGLQRTRFSSHLVAGDESGNFVVVWSSYGQDGSDEGVFGQRYDSAGEARGDEFRVNSYTIDSQARPSVASDATGNFVVVWNSFRQDGSQFGVFGQRYDGAGEPLGTEFRVNSTAAKQQIYPSLASDSSGNFVVVWSSYGQDGSGLGIFGQRYDSGGVPLGDEFQVNSYTTNSQGRSSVASDASGNFVVVWESLGQDGGIYGIFGQRYDSAGLAQGDEFRVNSYTTGIQGLPSVASDASGNFVVVWNSAFQDGESLGIFGQRYDSAGGILGSEFRVNSYTPGSQGRPSVASDAGGNFLVIWEDYQFEGQGGDYQIFGRRYDGSGRAQGDQFQINSFAPGAQRYPSGGATGTNQFVVAWTSAGQDGSGDGVFGQRFDFRSVTVVSPNTNVKWRIGSLHQIQWVHNIERGSTFRIELDRNDDGTYEELIAAAAPADNALRGTFGWTVTGPPSGTARVRVSWTDDLSVSDASDVTFQIRPVGLD